MNKEHGIREPSAKVLKEHTTFSMAYHSDIYSDMQHLTFKYYVYIVLHLQCTWLLIMFTEVYNIYVVFNSLCINCSITERMEESFNKMDLSGKLIIKVDYILFKLIPISIY